MKTFDESLEGEEFYDELDDYDIKSFETLDKPNGSKDLVDELFEIVNRKNNINLVIEDNLSKKTVDFDKINATDKALYFFNIGFTNFENENYYNAIENFKLALQLDENYIDAHHYIGLCYCEMNDISKGIIELNKVIELSATNSYFDLPDVYYDLGIIYHKKKELEKAIEYFDKAIELAKDYIHAYFAKGFIYNNLKKWELAIESFSLAIDYYNGESSYKDDFNQIDRLYYQSGKAYYKGGYFVKSYKCFESAYKINPEDEMIALAYDTVKEMIKNSK